MSDVVMNGLITSPPALSVKSKSDRVAEYFIVCGLDTTNPTPMHNTAGAVGETVVSASCIVDLDAGGL